MKQITVLLLFLSFVFCNAQSTITGTFSPAKDYTWLIAYRLKPGTQVYVADTAIEKGKFEFTLPKDSPKGTYRFVYAIPQEEFYFDVIYDGVEDINLSFNSDTGVSFNSSEENILFNTYFNQINRVERELISYYSKGSTDTETYQGLLKTYTKTQEWFEKKSIGQLANQFIKANSSYIPSAYISVQDFVKNRKESYFKNLDVQNPTLQASGFLTDKLTSYVFTALPLEPLEKSETEKEMKLNVSKVFNQLKNTNDTYSFHVLYTLWTQSSGSNFNDTADFIYTTYLKTSPVASNNKEIINKIETYNRLRIGAIAPNIEWKNGENVENLSALDGFESYILVFWSSTCGHCLKELPALHKELEAKEKTKVIAVGLENDDLSWKVEAAKLSGFEHAIALGKWDSEYANTYDIHATPTYFILDSNKNIIAKPETDKEAVKFLNEKN